MYQGLGRWCSPARQLAIAASTGKGGEDPICGSHHCRALRNSTDKSWVREDVQTALWAVMAQFRMLDCVNHNWSLLCNLYCAWRGQVCSINIYGYIYFAFKMETAVMYKAKTNQWKCWIWNHCIPITSKNVVLCYYFLLKYLLTMKYLNSKDLNFSKRIKFTLKLRWWDFICKALRGGGGEK